MIDEWLKKRALSWTFIFRRVCRAFGVVERYVRFPDNLSLDHEQVHRHCAPKQRPVSVRKKVHANPAQSGQDRAEQQVVSPSCAEERKRVG